MDRTESSDDLFVLDEVGLTGTSGPVLQSINLTISPLKLYLIAGPSGGGKTSLLRLLNGLEYPSTGIVSYMGRDVCSYDQPTFRSEVVAMTQEPVLFPGTVSDNISVAFSYESNASKDRDDVKVSQFMQRLGLNGDILKQDVTRLSGGEKQRIALIRSLILNPKVLIADEPTSALDPLSEEKVLDMFTSLKGALSMVVVSHSTRILELADEVVLIARGRIVEKGVRIDERQFLEFLRTEDGGGNG
jgi:ABC-type bacteriocin/lantibiotic exporter with double-glycine peptidase domain